MTVALPTSVTAFVAALSARAEIRAILLGGSRAGGTADADSDIDLYVCAELEITVAVRAGVIRPLDPAAEIDNRWFGTEDAWTDAESGRTVDIVYWDCTEIESGLRRVIGYHQPSLGYTTALWFTVHGAIPLYQRDEWFANLKALAASPYPDELRNAIIDLNAPLLRTTRASYLHQIQLAVQRQDAISVNHRVSALIASVTDIAFASHHALHPGEKRLATALTALPGGSGIVIAERINRVLHASIAPDGGLIDAVTNLCDVIDTGIQGQDG